MSRFNLSSFTPPKIQNFDLCHVIYWQKDIDVQFGKIKGHIVAVSPHPHTGSGETGPQFGHTVFRSDFKLLERLVNGEVIINVEASTPNKMCVMKVPDKIRSEGTRIATMSNSEWEKTPYYQTPASTETYQQYVRSFLDEFTRNTRHIPPRTLLDFYPIPMLFPSSVSVLVAKDGVAFLFDSPTRPEDCQVTLNTETILDELLLPHPTGKSYDLKGPGMVKRSICNDEHFLSMKNITHGSFWGNPDFVLKERRYHASWEESRFFRRYLDGTKTERLIKFGDIFGDISEDNFSEAKARDRAQKYAIRWIMMHIGRKQTSKPRELRTILNQLRELIEQGDRPEPKIEEFLDKNRWIIERGLGYKRYHSQVNIPRELLHKGKKGIKPDKFLEGNNGYCDILDLKRADAKLVVRKVNRSHASAKLSEAQGQVDKYRDLTREPKVREFLETKGIKILFPRGIVLMGRRSEKNFEEFEEVKKQLVITLYTYDDLLDEIEALVTWVEKIASN